jgi:2-hydroxycyclohexanecarboxyl-CoA dehydrogenase
VTGVQTCALPIYQLATPEQIAATVAFLAGPGSGAVIGQVLQPNGGVTRTRA